MNRYFFIITLAIFGLIYSNSEISAQDTRTCTPQNELTLNLYDSQLQLINVETGEVLQNLERIGTRYSLGPISPDCRYQVAFRPYVYHYIWYKTIIRDLETGEIVQQYSPDGHQLDRDGIRGPHRAWWTPDSQRIILETRNGTILWDYQNSNEVQLTNARMQFTGLDLEWDLPRQQVLILVSSTYYPTSENGVSVFDWHTGALLERYDNPAAQHIATGYKRISDNIMVVFSRYATPGLAGVTIWNRQTGENIQVDAGTDGALSANHIDLSPNGRYLAIGRGTIRVWDLHNLPEALVDRDPIYRHLGPDFTVRSITFVDDETLETVDAGGNIQQWDLHSGQMK